MSCLQCVPMIFVSTLPVLRRRGFGAAITHHALAAARDVAEYGVLGSSAAGRPVYERLGFREICTIDMYEYDPGS